jgi:Mg-chelatase subunit ChlD
MSAPPSELVCPLTGQVFVDPVSASDGHTYERAAIMNHVSQGRQSLFDGSTLEDRFFPNVMIKLKAAEWTAQQSGSSVAPSAAPQPAHVAASSAAFAFPLQSSGAALPVSLIPSMMQRADAPGTYDVNIGINFTGSEARLPCVCICILDVSGSMGLEASLVDPNSGERDGLTRMDLVKHATKAVINMLGDNDYVAIVSYNHAARLVLDLTQTSQIGRDRATVALGTLSPDGRTNIWDGLREALAIASKPVCAGKNVHMLLLTDGEPNENPPRGIVPTLQSFLNSHNPSVTISTFGFGYEMDSTLLSDISKAGNGMYAYIPDASLVGTVFSNFISNALATAVPSIHFAVACNGCQLSQFHNYAAVNQPDSSVKNVSLRNLHFGQSKDVLMTITGVNVSSAIAIRVTSGDGSFKDLTLNSWGNIETVMFKQQQARNIFIDMMTQALLIPAVRIVESQKIVSDLLTALPPADLHPNISALRRDVVSDAAPELQEGQVSKAFSRADWLTKWGFHYVKSLVRAHSLQECSNFKDPGVQVYGGPIFKQLQEAADTLFVSMPAPVPSATRPQVAPSYSINYASASAASSRPLAPAPAPAPVQMDRYMDRYGGCLHPNGRVLLFNGTTKAVKDLRQGDVLSSGARVRCNVQLSINAPISMCQLPGGLLITPWHPIRMSCGDNDAWSFPADISTAKPIFVKNVYNLVLDSHHAVLVDGVFCVTLGHGFVHDKVVAHAFFGTSAGATTLLLQFFFSCFLAVLDFLSRLPGWDLGLVRCSGVAIRGCDGRVCGFEQDGQNIWQEDDEVVGSSHSTCYPAEVPVIMQLPVSAH